MKEISAMHYSLIIEDTYKYTHKHTNTQTSFSDIDQLVISPGKRMCHALSESSDSDTYMYTHKHTNTQTSFSDIDQLVNSPGKRMCHALSESSDSDLGQQEERPIQSSITRERYKDFKQVR